MEAVITAVLLILSTAASTVGRGGGYQKEAVAYPLLSNYGEEAHVYENRRASVEEWVGEEEGECPQNRPTQCYSTTYYIRTHI